jgi:hypothetical protein
MKRLLLITLLIGYIYPCVAQDKPIRTEESLEGTVIYKKTTTFEVDGYTYQCDVDDGSQFVTLYNKENKLTYKEFEKYQEKMQKRADENGGVIFSTTKEN